MLRKTVCIFVVLILYINLFGDKKVSNIECNQYVIKNEFMHDFVVANIAIDNLGNCIFIGYRYEKSKTENIIVHKSYIVKFDKNLDILWSKLLEDNLYPKHINIDNSDNIIVSGVCELQKRYKTVINSTFIIKFAPDSTVLWNNSINPKLSCKPNNVALDKYDQIYIVGELTGSAEFEDKQVNKQKEDYPVGFIAKMSDKGEWGEILYFDSGSFVSANDVSIIDDNLFLFASCCNRVKAIRGHQQQDVSLNNNILFSLDTHSLNIKHYNEFDYDNPDILIVNNSISQYSRFSLIDKNNKLFLYGSTSDSLVTVFEIDENLNPKKIEYEYYPISDFSNTTFENCIILHREGTTLKPGIFDTAESKFYYIDPDIDMYIIKCIINTNKLYVFQEEKRDTSNKSISIYTYDPCFK